MKIYSLRILTFLCVGYLIYFTGGFLSQIKPFEIQSLLPDNHPTRVLYEDYTSLYNDEAKVFILVNSPEKTLNPKEIFTISDQIHKVIKHSHYTEKIIAISEAKFINFANKRLEMTPFISNDEISIKSQKVLSSDMWKNILISPDQKNILITFELTKKLKKENEVAFLDKLYNKINTKVNLPNNSKIHYFGAKAANYHFTYEMRKNQNIITPLLLLMIGIFLFIVFRSFQVVLWSYIVMIVSYCILIMVIIFNEKGIGPYSIFALSFIMVVSTSDMIHYFSRLYQQSDKDLKIRVQKAKEEILMPCFYTSLTTSIGFSSLIFNDTLPIKNFGLYCALGSFLCFFLTFFILPHILVLFNFKGGQKEYKGIKTNYIWKLVSEKPSIVMGCFFVYAGLLIFGSTQIELDDNLYTKFQDYHPLSKSVKAFEAIDLAGTIDVLITLDKDQKPFDEELLLQLNQMQERIKEFKYVSYIHGLSNISNRLNNELNDQYQVQSEKEAVKKSAFRLLRNFGALDSIYNERRNILRFSVFLNSMKSKHLEQTITQINTLQNKYPFKITVSGFSAVRNFVNSIATKEFIISFGLSIVLIFIVFLVLFKSLKVAIAVMIPNIIPLLTISGLMGLFQITMESNLVVLTCITIGLAVDDTIHFMFEYKKQLLNHPYTIALKNAIHKSSQALIGTTTVFIFSFPCFFLADLKLFFQVGIFLLLSILMALICDLLVLPIVLTKLGVKKL